MGLGTGAKLGPYEIVASLGAGGMGEVYRARDSRLGREVAIKVLPESFARDADRLQRFEHEARIVSTLNHPNILAIFDVGTQDGTHYLVSELLEGQTLREKMGSGPLSQRRVREYALEMAQGLAAAHEKGVVHRDLKPDNIFVTKDGRLKILDFGLARQTSSGSGSGMTQTVAGPAPTTPGTVMGTVGYMSPEQVRGQVVDQRSDLFSLGAILYEMVSGKRAFKGESGVETMNSILKDDPPELNETGLNVAPGLDRIVRHCLEKEPGMRFQSARDLAFDLESLSAVSSSSVPATAAGSKVRRLRTPLLVAVPLLLLAAAAAFWAGRVTMRAPEPVFTRLTFRGGHVSAARFSPDGQTIVYSAEFGDEPLQIYNTRPEAAQSRELGFKHTGILAVSKQDELAITLNHISPSANLGVGTLARMPLTGGAPRELIEDVGSADWSPDGQSLAVAVITASGGELQYPLGKSLYKSAGWVYDLRVSPDGNLVAFIDHPILWDSLGSVVVIDREGHRRVLAGPFSDARGVAWASSGKEVWFTASQVHLSGNLYAVDLQGHQRLVWAGAGSVRLQDISSDGKVLFIRENRRRGIAGLFPGHNSEVDLSWQDWSLLTRISPDGKWIFFSEEGDGGGQRYAAYMRATDGSPAIRLGDGSPYGLSPDGKWVASIVPGQPQQFWLLPTRVGQAKNMSQPGFDYDVAIWMPDGKRLMIQGREPGKATRSFLSSIDGGPLTPVTPEGVIGFPTEDGKSLVTRQGDTLTFYPVDGGTPHSAKTPLPDLILPMGGTAGRYLIGAVKQDVPFDLYRYDVETGQRQNWKSLVPADRAGVYLVWPFDITPDSKWYAYSYVRDLSDLYMVEGLK